MGARRYGTVFREAVVQASGREVAALAFTALAAIPAVAKVLIDSAQTDDTDPGASPAEERPEPETSRTDRERSDEGPEQSAATTLHDRGATATDRAGDGSQRGEGMDDDRESDDGGAEPPSEDVLAVLWEEQISWEEFRWRIAHYEPQWAPDSLDEEFADEGHVAASYEWIGPSEHDASDATDSAGPDDLFTALDDMGWV